MFHFSAEELEGYDVKALLERVSTEPDRLVETEPEVREIDRSDTRIYWLEQTYTNKEYNRAAKFRAAIARGPARTLITMSYWANRAPDSNWSGTK